MDNSGGSVQEIRKRTQKVKAKKKKPMKVVYISNPIKFITSASQFRALVQQLTGQDSELPQCSTGFNMESTVHYHVGGDQTVLNHSSKPILDDDNDDDDDDEILPLVDLSGKQQQHQQQKTERSDAQITESAAAFDDIFTVQMFENLSGLMPSSSLFYESAHVNLMQM